MKKIFCLFAMGILGLGTIPAWALTVEEAYAAIPHQRTVFEPSAGQMSAEDKDILVRLFELVDRAIVERVRLMQALSSRAKMSAQYDDILKELDELNVPAHLKQVRQLIRDAVVEQKEFLAEWKASGYSSVDVSGNGRVQSASQKLREAYALLMAAYPNEGQHNQAAFFDYLCALDFI